MCVRVFTSAVLICAWAEKGADALGPDGVVVHSDAFSPEVLVDTLGAGDTFNASVIYCLSHGQEMHCSILIVTMFFINMIIIIIIYILSLLTES